MHLAKTKPKLLFRELLSAPSRLPSARGHKLLLKHSSQTKEQGWEVPEELLTADRGEGSCLGFGSTLPTYRAAFNLSLPGWLSPGDNPSPCHPASKGKAAQGTACKHHSPRGHGQREIHGPISAQSSAAPTSSRASDLRIDPAGPRRGSAASYQNTTPAG